MIAKGEHGVLWFMTGKKEVPYMVKRKFDILQTRFGAIFVRAIEIIKEKNLIALKKFLSTAFRDTRDRVRDLESMDQLEEFLLYYVHVELIIY